MAYALALTERWSLTPKYYEAEIGIALRAIENKLVDLTEEVMERDLLAEGLISVDEPFRDVRSTWLAALLCVLGIWRKAVGEEPGDVDRFVRRFSEEALKRPSFLWGEAAIRQFLAIYWHNRLINVRSGRADRLLAELAGHVGRVKRPGGEGTLPDVYTGAAEFLPHLADQRLAAGRPAREIQLAGGGRVETSELLRRRPVREARVGRAFDQRQGFTSLRRSRVHDGRGGRHI